MAFAGARGTHTRVTCWTRMKKKAKEILSSYSYSSCPHLRVGKRREGGKKRLCRRACFRKYTCTCQVPGLVQPTRRFCFETRGGEGSQKKANGSQVVRAVNRKSNGEEDVTLWRGQKNERKKEREKKGEGERRREERSREMRTRVRKRNAEIMACWGYFFFSFPFPLYCYC